MSHQHVVNASALNELSAEGASKVNFSHGVLASDRCSEEGVIRGAYEQSTHVGSLVSDTKVPFCGRPSANAIQLKSRPTVMNNSSHIAPRDEPGPETRSIHLPPDVMLELARHLSPPELACLRQTCQFLASLLRKIFIKKVITRRTLMINPSGIHNLLKLSNRRYAPEVKRLHLQTVNGWWQPFPFLVEIFSNLENLEEVVIFEQDEQILRPEPFYKDVLLALQATSSKPKRLKTRSLHPDFWSRPGWQKALSHLERLNLTLHGGSEFFHAHETFTLVSRDCQWSEQGALILLGHTPNLQALRVVSDREWDMWFEDKIISRSLVSHPGSSPMLP